MKKSVLVIGYGNTLRGDDGAGYHIAQIVEAWDLPDVRSFSVHQLTPDLAADIAEVKTVIFIDAIGVGFPHTEMPDPWLEPIERPIEPFSQNSFTGHHIDPRSLLALTEKLYQKRPIAYHLLIPALDFEFGESFSEMTHQAVQKALQKLQQSLGSEPFFG